MCMSRLHKVVGIEGTRTVDVEDLEGAVTRASLLAVDGLELTPGDWVVVHSGYVIDRVDPVEAREIVDEIRRAGVAGVRGESEVGS